MTPQLVRRYFGSRNGLLSALYEREWAAHRESIRQDLRRADDFEAIVRVFVQANFHELSTSTALGRLRNLTEITESARGVETSGLDETNRLLLRSLLKEHDVPRHLAVQALRMGSAASIAAGDAFAHHGGDEAAQIDATVAFVLAGVRALEHRP